MEIMKLIRFTLYTYILVLFGVSLGAELYLLFATALDELFVLMIWLLFIILLNILFTGIIRNIVNYIIIGSVFGIFVSLTTGDIEYLSIMISSGIGVFLTVFTLLWVRLKIKQPLVYLLIVFLVVGFIAEQIFNGGSFGYVLSLLFFILVVPFLNLINISNVIHNQEQSFFSKNPLILAVFPLFLFAMPSTDQVLIPEPLEINLEEQQKNEKKEQE